MNIFAVTLLKQFAHESNAPIPATLLGVLCQFSVNQSDRTCFSVLCDMMQYSAIYALLHITHDCIYSDIDEFRWTPSKLFSRVFHFTGFLMYGSVVNPVYPAICFSRMLGGIVDGRL